MAAKGESCPARYSPNGLHICEQVGRGFVFCPSDFVVVVWKDVALCCSEKIEGVGGEGTGCHEFFA